jgi:hypothetical protein
MRVEITLVRVKITLGGVFWKIERVLAKKYLKIDACQFLHVDLTRKNIKVDFHGGSASA